MRPADRCHIFGNAKILIVEDSNISRAIIRELLREHGFLNVEEAQNGLEGFEKAVLIKPDLIIMDIEMPVMDGLECCDKIRGHPVIANTPILTQTALSDSTDKIKIFDAGADDYISKPIDPNELVARLSVHLEHHFMAQNLRRYNVRVKQELKIARETQNVLSPSDEIIQQTQDSYPLSIYQHFETSSEMGGDFWGFRSLSTHQIAIYLVDFSGHGINAALNTFRLHALMQNNLDLAHQPGAYLTQLNVILTPLLPTEQFATMFYGVIDIQQNSLSYATAAAPPPIMFSQNGQNNFLLQGRGLPLGVAKDRPYDTYDIAFQPSDMIFLYSDALIETTDKQGEYFEHQAIINIMQRSGLRDGNAKKSFDSLLHHFKEAFGKKLCDDLTLSAYYYKGQ